MSVSSPIVMISAPPARQLLEVDLSLLMDQAEAVKNPKVQLRNGDQTRDVPRNMEAEKCSVVSYTAYFIFPLLSFAFHVAVRQRSFRVPS